MTTTIGAGSGRMLASMAAAVIEPGGITVVPDSQGDGGLPPPPPRKVAGVSAMLDVNVIGIVRVTHAFLPLLRRDCTERSGRVVDLYLYLAASLVTLRMLIWQASSRYRWGGRPTSRRLT